MEYRIRFKTLWNGFCIPFHKKIANFFLKWNTKSVSKQNINKKKHQTEYIFRFSTKNINTKRIPQSVSLKKNKNGFGILFQLCAKRIPRSVSLKKKQKRIWNFVLLSNLKFNYHLVLFIFIITFIFEKVIYKSNYIYIYILLYF